MEYTIEKLPKSEIRIKVTLVSSEFQEFLDRAIREIGREIEISGFRKGTAPLEIIKKNLSQEQHNFAIKEAIDRAIQNKYLEILQKEKLDILGQPKAENIDLKEDSSLHFEVIAAIFPEFSLPDYKTIVKGIQKREISLEEKEIETALEWLRKSRAKFSAKESPAEKGDWVEIEYQSEKIEGNKIFKDNFILGEGKFVPGFEDQIIGMKRGSDKKFKVVFPDNYHRKDLAGQEVEFYLKLNTVQKMEIPELTDEWAKTLGEFSGLDDLRKSIRDGLIKEKEIAEKSRLREEILAKIRENTKIEIPEILVNEMQERMLADFKEKISQQFNLDFNTYLSQVNKTEAEIRESFRKLAEERVANSLILQEIIKQEEIKVTPEEVEEKINVFLSKSYNLADLKKIDLERLKSYYKNELEIEKAFNHLESFLEN